MTVPLRTLTDAAHRVDEVWRNWRSMATAPPVEYVEHWSVWRSNGGMVQVQFTSEMGWVLWARFLGLDMDTHKPGELRARGVVDGVRFVLYCPHQAHDEAGAA